MGSILNINIYFIDNELIFIDNLKNEDYQIIATAATSKTSYNAVDYGKKIVLIVGNEGSGIDDMILSKANYSVNIPIDGTAESLNAGIAAGIMMYKIKEKIESK